MRGALLACLATALALAAPAAADDWWPHPADANWVYQWTDTGYAVAPTTEKVTVKQQKGKAFTLEWTTAGQGNGADAVSSNGTVDFSETTFGINNTDWASTPPPPDFPILCSQAGGCANSLSSTLYYLIWGSRTPLLAEPLLKDLAWSATGGARGDVTSTSTYRGTELVKVPAFPDGVSAAKIRTEVTQAGALGDPYGSGVRTVWWVHGVGPVKMTFEHSGGADAPLTTSELQSTNQAPTAAPHDANYFPLKKGDKHRFSWTNSKHMTKPSVQELTVDDVVNGTARFSVKSISGPLKVAGTLGYSTRVDGVTNLWGFTKAATALKFPPLGPADLATSARRHFFTPFDLMNFGFNPVLTAYPAAGDTWGSKIPSRDFSVFGVTGSAKTLGFAKVHVPAGTFDALVVRATLTQPGFPFGSGMRTSYFADGKGLVKLVFRHGDGSVSTVVLLK